MGAQNRTVEALMGEIAGAAHGVATHRWLLEAGISRREIAWRLRVGALLEEYPGVYRVGHRAASTEATYMAAVLACGEGSLLCGRAAAYLWGLIKGAPPVPEVVARTERRVAGIITHRARRQPGADAGLMHGIPATTVARTLVDLATVLSAGDLARACHEAGVHYDTTPTDVEAVLARRPSTPGAGKLLRITSGDTKLTLSRLERRFLQRLREAGMPLPETNRPAGGRRVDCRWPAHRLTVELDSYRFHRSRHAWERDRHREREARARGDDFRRYTWSDVFEHPRLMMRELQTYFAGSRPA